MTALSTTNRQPVGFYLRCCSLWQGSTSCSELMQDARGRGWKPRAAGKQVGICLGGKTLPSLIPQPPASLKGKLPLTMSTTSRHPAEAATEPRICPWGCWLQSWDFPRAPAPSAPARTELKFLSPCSVATTGPLGPPPRSQGRGHPSWGSVGFASSLSLRSAASTTPAHSMAACRTASVSGLCNASRHG